MNDNHLRIKPWEWGVLSVLSIVVVLLIILALFAGGAQL